MELVQACLSAREDRESPLWKHCVVDASLFKRGKGLIMPF